MTVNVPSVPTSAVPSNVSFASKMVIVLPDSACPVTVVPFWLTLSITAGVGGVRSTVNVGPVTRGLLLPAASLCCTASACSLSVSGVPGVKLHLPSLPTVTWPICTPLSKIVMVSPDSPVPVSIGWVSLVTPLLAISPVIVPTSSNSSVMIGMLGAV